MSFYSKFMSFVEQLEKGIKDVLDRIGYLFSGNSYINELKAKIDFQDKKICDLHKELAELNKDLISLKDEKNQVEKKLATTQGHLEYAITKVNHVLQILGEIE